MITGLILFAHGARDPRWREPFECLLHQVSSVHDGPVSLAFLESMSPSLIEAAKAVTQQGAGRVVVVPLFLAVGGHIRKDLPPLMEAAARACGVPVSAAEPAGESTQVQSALAAYCLDAARSTA